VLKLYQFPTAFGLPNASPFCMKLETYLRMAGLPFETVASLDMRRAPKGKMPWIDDGGTILGDSNLIIDYLKAKYGDPLDAWLSPAERAVALAFRRLIEENLYWVLLYSRWVDPSGWVHTRPAFFSGLPWPLRAIVPIVARRGLARQIWGQGIGRHGRDEIYAIGIADLSALAAFLGDKPWMMGEHPSVLDAVAYATLANILWAPVDSPLQRHLAGYALVATYCQRMRSIYYGA